MIVPPSTATGTNILTWRDGGVRYVQIARPDRANSYDQKALVELEACFASCDQETGTRVIVVCSAGSSVFCAGADRGDLAERSWRDVLTLRSANVFRRIEESRRVTIAAINGAAVGGGVELALACDLIVAAENASFRLPEPELGLLPAAGAIRKLSGAVGRMRANELILGGASWSAQDAFSFGLVNDVVPLSGLWDRVRSWCQRIVARDELALELAKTALRVSEKMPGGHGEFDLMAQALLVTHGGGGAKRSNSGEET